jgi:hypothetical protein
MSNIYIQIGSGAGDLDSRVNFRDGFSELIKKLDSSTIDRILKAQSVVERLVSAGYQPNGNGIDPHGYDWSFIKNFN